MVCALYRRNGLIGMVARLASYGLVGPATLSFHIHMSKTAVQGVADSGAYTSHHRQGLNSDNDNIVLLLHHFIMMLIYR